MCLRLVKAIAGRAPLCYERSTGGVFVTHCELLESKATMMDEAWPIAKNTTVATSLEIFCTRGK